ncbi:hypothetical protein XENTR_v10023704 [Xenopus tropicalis]|nr:hypothetical protein XENTR_v10023704 [Xenopus tropicalis]
MKAIILCALLATVLIQAVVSDDVEQSENAVIGAVDQTEQGVVEAAGQTEQEHKIRRRRRLPAY